LEKTRNITLGFTLIEVLIALALAALVTTVLTIGIKMIVGDWQRTEHKLEEKFDASLALLQIETALEGAFAFLYPDRKENKNYIFFEGKKDSLKWVSTVSPKRDGKLTAWQLKRGKDDRGLQVRITTAFAENPSALLEKTDPIELFEGFSVNFEYLEIEERDKNTENEKSIWLEKWDGKNLQSLPKAVRISLSEGQTEENPLEIIAIIPANEHLTLRPIKPQ
jgi:prepilin-type N-terminal cleavage/methylation domain-containing protein